MDYRAEFAQRGIVRFGQRPFSDGCYWGQCAQRRNYSLDFATGRWCRWDESKWRPIDELRAAQPSDFVSECLDAGFEFDSQVEAQVRDRFRLGIRWARFRGRLYMLYPPTRQIIESGTFNKLTPADFRQPPPRGFYEPSTPFRYAGATMQPALFE